MNKLFTFAIIGLLAISFTSAYFCIEDTDNLQVKMFKNNVNVLSIQQDLDNNVTEEALYYKIKYFNPCRV